MNSVREFLEHPQLAARNRWADIGSEAGPLRALTPRCRWKASSLGWATCRRLDSTRRRFSPSSVLPDVVEGWERRR